MDNEIEDGNVDNTTLERRRVALASRNTVEESRVYICQPIPYAAVCRESSRVRRLVYMVRLDKRPRNQRSECSLFFLRCVAVRHAITTYQTSRERQKSHGPVAARWLPFKRSSASKEQHKGRWCQRVELENDEERRETRERGLKGSMSGTNASKREAGGKKERERDTLVGKEGTKGVGRDRDVNDERESGRGRKSK